MNQLKKAFLIGFGTLNVGLGVVGVFVPLMPTTVFLIIASACFLRSSDRLYRKLIEHPQLGSFIKDWQEHRAMPQKAKNRAYALLWISLSISALIVRQQTVALILLGVGIGVSLILYAIPTLKPRP